MSTNGSLSGAGSPSANGHETRWAAVSGLWRFDGPSARYLGPSDEGPQSYGIALTNWNLTDGSVQVRIIFSEVDSEGHISAGLVLGFQSERSRYLTVQLGAWGRAYAIGEYVPGVSWQGIESVGSARNLEAKREYDIDLRQTGQE